MTVAVFTHKKTTYPHSSLGFHRLPACLALPLPVRAFCSCFNIGECMWQMFLQCMKAMLNTSSPKFFLTQPKTYAIGLLYDNCSLMNKILSCPPSPFFPIPSLFPALFLTVWDTTLYECCRLQRYPYSDFVMCMANWLFWMVLSWIYWLLYVW